MGVPKPEADQAVEWVEKALQSELLQKAKKSGKVFRELPVTGKQTDGSYLNAIIDLAFLENDEWVIVDYKSDRDQEERKEKYKKQLGIYGELLEKWTGKKIKSRNLYFLRTHQVLPV